MNPIALIKRLLSRFKSLQNRQRQAGSSSPADSARHQRELAADALEPRILYSAAPVEAPAQEAPAQEAPAAVAAAEATPAVAAPQAVPAPGSAPVTEGTSEISSHQQVTLVDVNSGQPLQTLDDAIEGEAAEGSLDAATLQAFWNEGIDRWSESGLSNDQLGVLQNASVEIHDLHGNILGATSGSSVVIDDDGAGTSWFVDATPDQDEEFADLVSGPAGIDLLSVVMHEQGHILGLGEIERADLPTNNVMNGGFGAGERRLPGIGQAEGAVAGSLEGVYYAVLSWNGIASGDNDWSGLGDSTSWSGTTYQNSDDVVFDGINGLGEVDITGVVRPTSITNTANPGGYTFDIESGGKLQLTGETINSDIRINASVGGGGIDNISGSSTINGAVTLNQGLDVRGSNITWTGGITSAGNQGISFNGSNHIITTNPIDLNGGGSILTITSAGNNKANATQLNVGGNDWGWARINFGGYLLVGGANYLAADGNVQFGWHTVGSSAGTLDLNGHDQTVNALRWSDNGGAAWRHPGADRSVTSTGGDATLTINTASGTHRHLGNLEGGLSIVKTGGGVQELENISGTASSYTGDTRVEGGTLRLLTADLPDTTDVYLTTGATLDLTHGSTDTIQRLFIDGANQTWGTWGAVGSGADHETSLITGSGLLRLSPVDDSYTTDEDTPLPDNVLANDPTGIVVSEVQGSSANLGVATATDQGGSVTIAANGNFTYDPNGQFDYLAEGQSATDTFTYTVAGTVELGAGGSLAGAGLADGGGSRLNIDLVNTTTLDAGTYEVPSVSFNATSGGVGVIRPFIVRDLGGGSWETLWVGAAIDAVGGQQTVNYTGETFTLTSTEKIYSGVYHNGVDKVLFRNGFGSSDHDNSVTLVPTAAGQTITGISNASLGRTYAFGVEVTTTDTATATVTVNGVNDAPVLNSVAVTSVDEGDTSTLSGTISDVDAPANNTDIILTVDWGDGSDLEVIDLAALPAGATFNPASGDFSIEHDYADDSGAGTYAVAVQAFERLAWGNQGLWNFNDGTATDGTANGNDGSAAGSSVITYTTDTPTQLGGGQSASSAQSGYLTVATSASLESMDDQMTVAFWIKADAAENSNWVRMIRKGTEAGGQTSWMVNRFSNSSDVNMRTDTVGAGGAFNRNRHGNAGDIVLDGNWHHVAYVIDGTSTKEYVDGSLNSTQTVPIGDGLSNTADLRILGKGGGTQSIDGAMDDVAVWNRPLTAAEIAAIAAGAIPSNGASAVVNTTASVANLNPTANADTDSTDENTSITTDVLDNDTDPVGKVIDPLTVTGVNISATTGLTGSPAAAGSVSIVGNQIKFDPGTAFDELDANDTATVTVDYDISDGDGGISSSTLTITVDGLNDAPVLAAGVAPLTAVSISDVNNGGDLVSSLINGQISDADDSSVEGIAITGATIDAGGSGKFQFFTAENGTWMDIGTVSDASALVLRTTDRVRFVPDTMTFNGGTLSFRAWDQTDSTASAFGTKISASSNGGTTPFSAETRSSAATVVNLTKNGDEIVFTAGDTGEVNDIRVTYDAGTSELIITDHNGNLLTSSVGTGSGTNQLRIVVDNDDNLFINTGDEKDEILIDDLGNDFSGNLTLDGGADQDQITYSATGVALAGSNSATFTAEQITHTVGSTLTTDSGNVILTGTGASGGNATGVTLDGASISSTTGDIALTGAGGDSGHYNRGILIDMHTGTGTASSISTGGAVTLIGSGGSGAIHNSGVAIVDSTVTSSGSDAVTITGTGGSGTLFSEGVAILRATVDAGTGDIILNASGGSTGNMNRGANIAVSTLTSNGGSINLSGTGAGSQMYGIGIDLNKVTATTSGLGTITIDGTGASGTLANMGVRISGTSALSTFNGALDITGEANGSTLLNHGIQVASGSQIAASGSGTVTLDGTGGIGTTLNHGIQMASNSTVSVNNGKLTLKGLARGTMTLNKGVELSASTLSSSGSGDIEIMGTGSAAATGVLNHGVELSSGSRITTNTGHTTMTGIGGKGSSLNQGIRIIASTLQSTGAGNFDLLGQAHGMTTGVFNTGVYILGATLDSAGTFGITGSGGGGTALNHGVYMLNILPAGSVTATTAGTAGGGDTSLAKAGNFFPV